MRSFPIDVAALMANVESVLALDPVVDNDTGEQRRNRDGIPRWKVHLLYREGMRRREIVEIGFAAVDAPTPQSGDELVLTGLVGRHWENTNDYGTSSGVAMSAEAVGFKPAAGRTTSSGNGQRRPSETAA